MGDKGGERKSVEESKHLGRAPGGSWNPFVLRSKKLSLAQCGNPNFSDRRFISEEFAFDAP